LVKPKNLINFAPMKEQEHNEIDLSAEQKIKAAAQKLFTQKGYASVKTRDIAAEAGINLALLNYYFRSKEKLFELVMADNMIIIVEGAAGIIHDKDTNLDQKVERLTAHYINVIRKNPDVPQFVLTEIKNHPDKLAAVLGGKLDIFNSVFIKQIQEKAESGEMVNVNPVQFLVNLLGLTVFPFIARPLLLSIGRVDEETFGMMMEQRKLLIPIWIKAMYQPPINTSNTASL